MDVPQRLGRIGQNIKRKPSTRNFTFIININIIDFHAVMCVFFGAMFKKERHNATP